MRGVGPARTPLFRLNPLDVPRDDHSWRLAGTPSETCERQMRLEMNNHLLNYFNEETFDPQLAPLVVAARAKDLMFTVRRINALLGRERTGLSTTLLSAGVAFDYGRSRLRLRLRAMVPIDFQAAKTAVDVGRTDGPHKRHEVRTRDAYTRCGKEVESCLYPTSAIIVISFMS